MIDDGDPNLDLAENIEDEEELDLEEEIDGNIN